MLPILTMTLAGCIPELTSPEGQGSDGPWTAPENGWPKNEPPADLVGEGFAAGEVIPDVRAADQHGDEVSLWQFHGMILVLDISTMWCSPCQEIAGHVEETAEHFADHDFVYVTMFPENVSSQVPTTQDLVDWGEYFQITQPLLSDDEGYSYEIVPDAAFPALLVIDRDLRVHTRVTTTSDAAVRAAVEEIL